MTRQGPHGTIDIEVLHGQAEVVDVRGLGARLCECQEVRSIADTEKDLLPLARLHGHAEEPLVEIQRALQIRDCQRYLVESAHTERSGLPLREQTAGEGQPRQGEKQAPASHHARGAGGLEVVDVIAHVSVTPLALESYRLPGQQDDMGAAGGTRKVAQAPSSSVSTWAAAASAVPSTLYPPSSSDTTRPPQ